jgi:bacillithiol biosynthesis deacetylase BshB2
MGGVGVERHVLVVLPHPDDETFGTGGTIYSFTKQGVPVTVACGTLGEMGRNMGKPYFATRESLPLLRERELRSACRILGVRDLRLLGLRDKTIEFEDREQLAIRILKLIRELRPTLVITHFPGHGVHPDHNALGAATVHAVGKLPPDERPRVLCHALTHDREQVLGQPDVVTDLSGIWEIKLEAVRAHRSQSEAMLAQMEGEGPEAAAARESLKARFAQERLWLYRWDAPDRGQPILRKT